MARLAFLGSPSVSATCLRALSEAGHEIVLVVSAGDKRRGRGGALLPTPVKALAVEIGIPVADRTAAVVGCGAELGVVVAYGRIIKADVLAALSMVNVHFSLLPRWRGAAPVERSILAGDERTGVCLMAVEEGLDTGGIYARAETPIGPAESADELTTRLGAIGARLLVEGLQGGVATLGSPEPQHGEATYADKIRPDELHLDFERAAEDLHRIVRVGRAWTTVGGRRLIVHGATVDAAPVGAATPGSVVAGRIATGEGFLVPTEVQEEGRRRQPFDEWLRGARLASGDTLS